MTMQPLVGKGMQLRLWHQSRNPKNLFGFTLIELVCALALGALVVSLLFGLVANLSRRERLWREKYPDDAWIYRVREQLERDFALAREVRWSRDRIELQGYGPVDPGSNLARPSEIVYLLRKHTDRTLLLRAANDLLEPAVEPNRTVMAEGIRGFSFKTGNRQGVYPGVVVLTVDFEDTPRKASYSFPLVRQGVIP